MGKTSGFLIFPILENDFTENVAKNIVNFQAT